MEVEKYINQKKDLYESFLKFISIDDLEDSFFELIKMHHINETQEELNHFFEMLISIANNHHRGPCFFDKIEQIILFFQKDIKKNWSNYDIYNMFESNKRLLLFLFEHEILLFDENIYRLISNKFEPNGMRYSDFFIPEMKKFKNPDQLDNQSNDLIEYEKKRHEGENDNYICSLIRQDSVEEFISFTNRTNFSLSNIIERSTFETHSFLNQHQPTLIEYAAFFGSIQIFQYLYLNNVNIGDSLWLYAIHSNNSDLLRNQIEKNHIHPEKDKSYENCLKESIKCHHNDIADYIKYNLLIEPNGQIEKANLYEQIASIIFQNCNYYYFPISFDQDFMFFNLFVYHYTKLINILYTSKKDYIESIGIFHFTFHTISTFSILNNVII